MFLFGGFFHPFIQAFQLFLKLFIFIFKLFFVFFKLLFAFAFLAIELILALKDDFLFLGLGFFAGFLSDARS